MRFFLTGILFCLATAPLHGDVFESEIVPLLETHCFDCHGDEEEPKGGANLEQFRSQAGALNERAQWGAVFEKVESRQMPPPKRKHQPTADERQKILRWIKDLAAMQDPILQARDPGKPVLRRLTRLEYNNTIRDLFGLKNDIFMFPERLPVDDADFDPGAAQMPESLRIRVREYGLKYAVLLPDAGLPGDNRAEHGFSNRGEAMNLSPLLLQKYLATAHAILSNPKLPLQSPVFYQLISEPGAAPLRKAPEKADASLSAFASVAEFAPNIDAPKEATDGGAVTVTYQFRFNVNTAFHEGTGGVWSSEKRNLRVPGGTAIRVNYGLNMQKALLLTPREDLWVAGFSTAEETSGEGLFTNHEPLKKVIQLSLSLSGGDPGERITELAVCVLGRRDEKGDVRLTVDFSDGTSHSLSHDISGGEGGGNTFFAFRAPDGLAITGLTADGSNFSGNHFLLDDLGFITASAGLPEETGPGNLSASEKHALAEERLSAFLPKVFRHPLSAETLARYLTLFDEKIAELKSFSTAMRVTLTASLASPEFLYFAGPGGGSDAVRPLDNFELASRLSYFLWSAPPDLELAEAALNGTLIDPQVLSAQTARLMKDSRIRELAESFAVQWLRLDQLYTAKPDPDLFRSFYFGQAGKRTLHGSFMVEALLLFYTVMVEDRSILDFIDAEYTWVNLRLASHYGLTAACAAQIEQLGLRDDLKDDLKSEQMHAVWWRATLPDRTRGGFSTMAGPLTVTSLPIRTSPVKRGAWLLETLFNRPPQEPKIAFVLDEDDTQRTDLLSVRQRFEEHRNQPSCYSCHIRLDPPGFAMEVFDPVGALRSVDAGQPVDASSEWNGTAFEGPAAFKSLLRQEPEEFVRGYIEHLLSYALGRKLEIFDMPAVDQILNDSRKDGWRFQSILQGIVHSYPFTHTRNQ